MSLSATCRSFISFFFSLFVLSSCSVPEQPVSKAEALALAHKIESSVARHNYTPLNHLLDEKILAARIIREGGPFFSRDLAIGRDPYQDYERGLLYK